jgi:threonine dehydratase
MAAVSIADVRSAAERLRGHVRLTPLLEGLDLARHAGLDVRLKMETLQRTGSFKFRGAANAILQLDPADGSRGVATHSSGNHALALATAARAHGLPCTVVMPHDASQGKRRAVQEAGAVVVPCEPTMASREAVLAELVARNGATVVPPFDHPHVIAGQGTIGLEILDQWPQVDVIVAPVGGGGLVGGTALAVRSTQPGVAVVAAEPAAVDDTARSVRSGVRQPPTNAPTLADGLRAGIGSLTLPLVQTHVQQVLTVSEPDIARWMRFVFDRLKLVIEPSAAVGVAAVAGPEFRDLAKSHGWRRVALVLCGGNVDLDRLPWG